MHAPVYRNLDARSTLFGLAFPTEWMFVLLLGWVGTAFGAPNVGAASAAAVYFFLRAVGYGKPKGYFQQWAMFQGRRLRSGGRLSAAARAPVPRFPFAPYEWQDAPPRRGRAP